MRTAIAAAEPEPLLLLRTDAANLLGISVATLRRMESAGQIRYTRIGGRVFYRREYLDEYIKSREIAPRSATIPPRRRAR